MVTCVDRLGVTLHAPEATVVGVAVLNVAKEMPAGHLWLTVVAGYRASRNSAGCTKYRLMTGSTVHRRDGLRHHSLRVRQYGHHPLSSTLWRSSSARQSRASRVHSSGGVRSTAPAVCLRCSRRILCRTRCAVFTDPADVPCSHCQLRCLAR